MPTPYTNIGREKKPIESLADCLQFRKQPLFNIGDEVSILLQRKSYDGIRTRTRILKDLCKFWSRVNLTNDPIYSDKKDPKRRQLADYFLGKRRTFARIHEEKKGWILKIMQVLDNPHRAFVYMVEPIATLGLSENMPSNICYLNGSYSKVDLIYYHVLIVGDNGVCFKRTFLSSELEHLHKTTPSHDEPV